jgi:poly(hydroxyalkanoate) depolymerase family esterase
MNLAPVLLTAVLGLVAACAAGAQERPFVPVYGGGGEWRQHRYSGHGVELDYVVYRPAGAAPAAGFPLLLLLHGCTQDGPDLLSGTGMTALAEERRVMLVVPSQGEARHPQRCWNWYEPQHQRREDGETAALAGLIGEVTAAGGVDPRRVYVGGISAGGAMALLLAAHYPERFAAVAAHSAVAPAAARNTLEALAVMRAGPPPGRMNAPLDTLTRAWREAGRPVPLLLLQGTEDRVVRQPNADAIEALWVEAAQRAGFGETTLEEVAVRPREGNGWIRRTRSLPGGQVFLDYRAIDSLGHAWSGGHPQGTYTDPKLPRASDWMLSFLLRYSLPEERP